MSQYRQKDRPVAVETPFGTDVLLMQRFTGEEAFSRTFRFELQLLSEKEGLDPTQIVGKGVGIRVDREVGGTRRFHGLCTRFSYEGKGERLHLYRAVLEPWYVLLKKTTDCRIFQEESTVDILTKIFGELGFSDYDLGGVSARGSQPRPYCVQYNETDFDFANRLLEEDGAYFFFEHEESKHTLVVADAPSAYKKAGDAKVNLASSYAVREAHDELDAWGRSYNFRSGKTAGSDYNYETSETDLGGQADAVTPLPGISKFELFEYPGEQQTQGEAEPISRLRIEEEEAGYEVAHGKSRCRTFSPGYKFTVEKHHAAGEAGKGYTISKVSHRGSNGGAYVQSRENSEEDIYANDFEAIPDAVAFRPPRTTPRPKIPSVQSAVVTGRSGLEIDPDEYGRITVQFHWDRLGKKDENTTCKIRCMQPFVGSGWGAMHVPRIGTEVLVAFVDGDPDRPVVTGMVYNDRHMPAHALPDHKTRTVWRSHSTPDGGNDNFNELYFEDKIGEEEIYFHAEHDFNRVVENDDTLKVGFEKSDPGDQTIEIYNDQTVTIGAGSGTGSQTIEIQADRDVTLKTGNDSLTVETGNRETQISVGSDTLFAMQAVEIESMTSVTLKVGGNSIMIDQSGVTINAINVTVSANGAMALSGLTTNLSASAINTISGAAVKIN